MPPKRPTSRDELEQRLEMLRPAVAEARRIQRLLHLLEESGEEEAALPMGVYRRRLPAKARLQQVLDLVRRSPGMRRKEIALALEVGQARAGQLVNELIDAGRLVEDGRGHLTVAEGIGH